jgi:tRNA 2-thiouridine synthesizing protein A
MNEIKGCADRGPARRTVAEVSRDPRAREVLVRLGINHCCGAQLSLAEAAIAAGVPIEELMRALSGAMTTATIDVRGLEPPQPLVRVLQRLDTLGEAERLEVVIDRRPLLLYPQLDARGFTHTTDEPEPGLFRIVIARAGTT